MTALTLNPIQQLGYDYGSTLLALSVTRNLIQPETIQFICDFGAGTGGPSLAMWDFFHSTGKRLTLLEADISQANSLKRILPDANLKVGDGLSWLSKAEETQDLITAFMLGPDYENSGIARRFLRHALPALSPHGKILICSDTGTMQTVKQLLQSMPEVDNHWILTDESASLPTTVIISRKQAPQTHTDKACPELPSAIIKKIDIPEVDGFWTTESYCLTTTFEKSYLHATIKTFELVTPEHPALPYLKDLWMENQ